MTKNAAKSRKVNPAALQTAGEQMLQDLQKAMGKKSFSNIGELNAFLEGLTGQEIKQPLVGLAPLSPKEEARELAYDAMEAGSEAQARKLAKRALAKDPECVDALVLLADLESDSPRQAIAALQKAVAAGERSLGARFIKENKGHFWLILETRPYMRALEHLASLLRAEGLNLEAIQQYETMLALNPGDNQGVRDPLLGLYLATGNLEGARKLLHEYGEDCMANFSWGHVLERFLSGDLAGASAALKTARQENRFVERYLSGQKKMPIHLPAMYSPGSEEEAILFLDNMLLAWAEHKEAIFWLLDQLEVEKATTKIASIPKAKKAPKGKIVLN